MSNFLSFMCGTIFGAFMAQNYDIINIKDSTKIMNDYLKKIEKDSKDNKN